MMIPPFEWVWVTDAEKLDYKQVTFYYITNKN